MDIFHPTHVPSRRDIAIHRKTFNIYKSSANNNDGYFSFLRIIILGRIIAHYAEKVQNYLFNFLGSLQPVALSFIQNALPGKARLKGFQDQHFIEVLVVKIRLTPL